MAIASHPSVQQLRELPLFADYTGEQLERISRVTLLLQKKEGDLVLTHGSAVIGLYVLLDGDVDVFLSKTKQAVFQLQAPTFLGELAFIDNKPASATVRVASPDLNFLVIPRDRLVELCASDPWIGMPLYRNLAHILATRLREANIAMSRIL